MERRPGQERRAEPDAGKEIIWVPAGAPPLTSAGVEVRYLGGGDRRAEAEAPLDLDLRGAERPQSIRTEPRRIEGRRGRRSDQPESKGKSSSRSKRRDGAQKAPWTRSGGGAVRFAERLPVARAPGDWQIPPAWDLPETEITTLGPDGEVPLPPEVDKAAEAVMALYEMRVRARNLITSKPDKGGAIWRIETDRGPRSLKLLHRQAQRSLFSIGAQEYLVKKGARVPPLVRTRAGDICVQTGEKLWIVTDWIEPLTPATKIDLTGAAQLCYGLGEFQKLSQGYVPPLGARYTSRLARWPKAYGKILTKIGWFREIAQAYREFPAAQTLLSMVDLFEQQAREAIARLQASAYDSLVARGDQAWGIVHQDR